MQLIRIIICVTVGALMVSGGALLASAEELPYEHPESIADPLESLLTPCGLSSDELQAKLYYDLANYAEDFLQAETDTGINAAFLCAVAALESGWGRYCANDNNLFGWTGNKGYMAFDSPKDCIAYVSKSIKENYLSPDGCYFNGYTVEAINKNYNGSDIWECEVKKIMFDILEIM